MITYTSIGWTRTEGDVEVEFFKMQLPPAEVAHTGMNWRAGYLTSRSSSCVVDLEDEPTKDEVESLY